MSQSDEKEPAAIEPGQSTVVLKAGDLKKLAPPPRIENAKHFLVVIEGPEVGSRFVVETGLRYVGRGASADIALNDAAVSSQHCTLLIRDESLLVQDLGSSNGTFVDEVPVEADADAATPILVGHHLRVGTTVLKHEYRSETELAEHAEFENDLGKAARYVESILPQPYDDRGLSIRREFRPSAKLGGDAFGFHWLDDDHLAIYLIDVCGHGTGSALHSVSVIQQLRTRSLGVDFERPEAVLEVLNSTFQMEDHAGMYFSAWYGVYQRHSHELSYASAGHPPAFLLSKQGCHRLQTKKPAIGWMPGVAYEVQRIRVSTPARLFVYSDGVFELVAADGTDWSLEAFLSLLEERSDLALDDQLRDLQRSLVALQGHDHFDDDQSVLAIDFKE